MLTMACAKGSGRKSNCFKFSRMADIKVSIYTRSDVADGIGGFTRTWALDGTYWAYMKPVSMNESYISEQMQSRVSHEIVIRYQSSLKDTKDTAQKIIKYDDRYFEVKGVLNLSHDLKSEGRVYQKIKVLENDAIEGTLP